MLSKFYEIYSIIQDRYYELMKANLIFRVVTIAFFCVTAPIIQALIWTPAFIDALIGFYRWVPSGLRGEERE